MNDRRLRYDEPAIGYGHPTLPDSVNRMLSADHNIDGTHRMWVDIRSFGAIGDNATDDTAAIQGAIAYAATLPVITSLRNTALVVVPHGKYKITSQLVVPSGVNFHCEGIIYNSLANIYTPGIWFKAGSHCSKLQLWGNLNSGVKFGEASASCNMQIGDVRLWNIGETAVGGDQQVGVTFTGYNFTFDSIDCDGGNVGIDINAASDLRGNKIISFTASTGLRITSGSEHIYCPSVDIDTPNFMGVQIDSSHDIAIHDCMIFLNDQEYDGSLTNAASIGEYSASDNVNNLRMGITVKNTGGQGLKLSNIKDSQIILNVTNATLATGNAHPVTAGVEFGTGVGNTVDIRANFGNVATKITGTGGCITYTDAGALKYQGPGGAVTTIAVA